MNRIRDYTKYSQDIFKKHGVVIFYKKGQQFVRHEDISQGIYYLDKGFAHICSTKDMGFNQIVGILEPGFIFGKVGSVMFQPSTQTYVEALSDCIVYRIDCESFNERLKKDRLFLESYMNQVSFNNVYLLNLVIILGEKDLYKRIVKGMLLLSYYYGDKNNDVCTLRISLTQDQLACFLCLSREYLNKIINKLKRKGLVCFDRGGFIKIPSMSNLNTEDGVS